MCCFTASVSGSTAALFSSSAVVFSPNCVDQVDERSLAILSCSASNCAANFNNSVASIVLLIDCALTIKLPVNWSTDNAVVSTTELNWVWLIKPFLNASDSAATWSASWSVAAMYSAAFCAITEITSAPLFTAGTNDFPISVPKPATASFIVLSLPLAVSACFAISPPKSFCMCSNKTFMPLSAGTIPFSTIFAIAPVDTPAASAKYLSAGIPRSVSWFNSCVEILPLAPICPRAKVMPSMVALPPPNPAAASPTARNVGITSSAAVPIAINLFAAACISWNSKGVLSANAFRSFSILPAFSPLPSMVVNAILLCSNASANSKLPTIAFFSVLTKALTPSCKPMPAATDAMLPDNVFMASAVAFAFLPASSSGLLASSTAVMRTFISAI